MKKRNIFIGSIKRCNNIAKYNKYGNSHFFAGFEEYPIGSTIPSFIEGINEKYVESITDQAILIKYDEERYIWLNSLIDYMFLACKHPINIVRTKPQKDNDIFVDTTCELIPYYQNEETENIGALKLRKEIKTDSKKNLQ